MPAKDYAATVTLETREADAEILPLDGFKVAKEYRLAPGQTLTVDIGDVRDAAEALVVTTPERCASWHEAAYFAHRLSKGRQKALAILRDKYAKPLTGRATGGFYIDKRGLDVAYMLRYCKRRGESAAVINGLKGLAADGLIEIDHRDGVETWYGKGSCDSRVAKVSDRAWQYAHALKHFKRPVGKISAAAPIDAVVAKLTPKTVEAIVSLVKMLSKQYPNGLGKWGASIYRPGRASASVYTALEKRGFVRWTAKEKNDDGRVVWWRFEIPAGSRLFEVAAFASADAAEALLTEGDD